MHCVLGLAARASVCISLCAWATVIWVLVHGPLSSKSWCTGQCVHISSRMGHCVLGLGARATVCAYVLGHGPVCSRSFLKSYFTGHRVPDFGARAVVR